MLVPPMARRNNTVQITRDPAYPCTSTWEQIIGKMMGIPFSLVVSLPAGLGGGRLASGEGTGSTKADQKGEKSSEGRHRDITNVSKCVQR